MTELVLNKIRSGGHMVQGTMMMLLAIVLYSVNDAMLKWMGESFHPTQIVFCRSMFSFLPLLFYTKNPKNLELLKTKKPVMHAIRGAVAFLSVLSFIYAFSELPLADAYAVIFIGPIAMAVFSQLLLGEKVSQQAWMVIIIGFLAVLYMMKPGSDIVSVGGIAAFCAGLLYALSLVLSRYLSRTESNFSISVWFNGAGVVGGAMFMPFFWQSPSIEQWLIFAALGVIGGLAQMAITQAFKLAPAYIVGPLDYLILVLGAIIGYFVWGDIPTYTTIIGAMILICCGLYLLFLGTKADRKAATPATPPEII